MDEENKLIKDLNLIVKSSVLVLIASLISKIFVYIYRVIIARYYGPEVFGLFSLAVMVLSLIIVSSSLGLCDGLLRYLSFYQTKKQKQTSIYMFQLSTKIMLVSSISAGILLFIFARPISIYLFHNNELIIFLKIFSFVVPITVIGNTFITVTRAYEKIGWFSFLSYLSHNIIKVCFILILIFIGLKNEAIAYSYLVGALGTLILAFLITKKIAPYLFKKNNMYNKDKKNKASKEILSYSLPLMSAFFISSLLFWADSFAIGFFKTAKEVGFYNAAVPLAMLLNILPELFMKLYFPLINKEYSKGKKSVSLIKELSKQIGKWIFIVNIPLVVILLLFPDNFLLLIFGEDYLPAAGALRILTISVFISSVFIGIPYRLISMIGKSRFIMYNSFLIVILNISLNFILVPMEKILFIDNTNGLIGASLSIMLSSLFTAAIYMWQTNRYLSFIPLRKKISQILLIALIAGALTFYIKEILIMNFISFIVLVIFFICLYALLILATNCLDRNDLAVLSSIKRKFVIKNPAKENHG